MKAIALALAAFAVTSFAQYTVGPQVISAGGSRSECGTHSIHGTIGQSAIGIINQIPQRGEIGFWHSGASFAPTIPIIVVERTATEVRIHFQNIGRGTYRLYAGDSPNLIDMNQPVAITATASYLTDPDGLEHTSRCYIVTHSNP